MNQKEIEKLSSLVGSYVERATENGWTEEKMKAVLMGLLNDRTPFKFPTHKGVEIVADRTDSLLLAS